MYAFCEQHGIRSIAAARSSWPPSEEELPRLQTIYERGMPTACRARCSIRDQLREIEPHANALQAIHSP